MMLAYLCFYVSTTGAHYDSRSENSTSKTNRAPGADDNGSGTAAMLELAKIVNTTSADLVKSKGCWARVLWLPSTKQRM